MHLASSQPSSITKGLLFGDSFIKEINKYVALFTSLDKAQSSLKKVFQPKFFQRETQGPISQQIFYRRSFPQRPSEHRVRLPDRFHLFTDSKSGSYSNKVLRRGQKAHLTGDKRALLQRGHSSSSLANSRFCEQPVPGQK